MYPGTRRHGKSPRAANARLTAGFRWAPDTLPMNRMIANTISPGAVTAAARPIVFGNAWPIIPPPAATSTRKNVPSSSEKSRRHSWVESWKSSIGFITSVLNHSSKRALAPLSPCVRPCTTLPASAGRARSGSASIRPAQIDRLESCHERLPGTMLIARYPLIERTTATNGPA